jgi:WD40 repeat protein
MVSLTIVSQAHGLLQAAEKEEGAGTFKLLGKPVQIEDEKDMSLVILSPDGKTVALWSRKTVQLYDMAAEKAIGKPLEHDHTKGTPLFSQDGKHFWTFMGHRERVPIGRLWDAATGEAEADPVKLDVDCHKALLSPDGKAILLQLSPDNNKFFPAELRDTTTGKRLIDPLAKSEKSSVTMSPDGKTLLAWGGGVVRFYNAADGKPIGKPLELAGVRMIVFSPNGKLVLAYCDRALEGSYLSLWDVETRKPVMKPIKADVYGGSVAFSADSKLLLTGNGRTGNDVAWAQLWDATIGKPMGEPLRIAQIKQPGNSTIEAAAFSPDYKFVVTACHGTKEGVKPTDKPPFPLCQLQLWDVSTLKPIGEPLWLPDRVTSIVFAPDGKSFITGSDGLSEQYVRHAARRWQMPDSQKK